MYRRVPAVRLRRREPSARAEWRALRQLLVRGHPGCVGSLGNACFVVAVVVVVVVAGVVVNPTTTKCVPPAGDELTQSTATSVCVSESDDFDSENALDCAYNNEGERSQTTCSNVALRCVSPNHPNSTHPACRLGLSVQVRPSSPPKSRASLRRCVVFPPLHSCLRAALAGALVPAAGRTRARVTTRARLVAGGLHVKAHTSAVLTSAGGATTYRG